MLLSRIVDTNGIAINFAYAASGNNRSITITTPGIGNYVIWMYRGANTHHQFVVNSISNQVNTSTFFSYEIGMARFDFFSKNPSFSNHTALLRQVTYPSGAQLRFDYSISTSNMGQLGSRHVWRVASRTLIQNNQEYQRTTFFYDREPTAFPQQVATPPRNHTYTVTVTQNNGLNTVYTFNYQHLNTQRRLSNGNILLSEEIMAYHNRLPTSVSLTEFRNNFTRNTQQSFGYNQFGQIIQTVSPLAQGSWDARYRTDFIHDNRFGLPLTVTTRPDNNTTIVERNTLSSDGRNVISTDIYENNIRMSRTEFSHDTFGNVTEIREFPNSMASDFITMQITFDRGTLPSSIRTISVRDVDGNLVGGTGIIDRRFTYDQMWRMQSETDPNGYITHFTYDGIGRIRTINFPDGGLETFTYNDSQNTMVHRTVLGAQYTYSYDRFGNLLTTTDPNGIIILTNVYDNRMRLVETRNAQGIASSQRTTFTYDIFDRVVEQRSLCPAGAIMNRTSTAYYDINDTAGNSRIVNTVHGDANAPSIQTFTQRDRIGRITQEGTIGGRVFNYTHDLAGRVTRETSLGVDNTFTYNLHGMTSVRNIEGNTSHNTYDHMGRLLTSSDFMGNTQRFTYDALGRLIRQDVPFEQVGDTIHYASTKHHYDANGNLIRTSSLINLPGQPEIWASTRNSFRHNRLVSTQTGGANTGLPNNADGFRTDYYYDVAGNIRVKTVGLGGLGATASAQTTFVYNNRGQLTSTTDALGQAETFTYDANGLLLTRTDRNGTLFRHTYDNMGRLISEEAVRSGVVTNRRSYIFTATGALRNESVWSPVEGTHTITYTYDAQGRLIRQDEIGGASGNVSTRYAYNTANNLTASATYVNGTRLTQNTYAYDTMQRVQSVNTNGSRVTYTYDANSNRTRQSNINGIATDYTFNLANMVTSLVNRQGDTVLSRFDYTYYLDGNTQEVLEELMESDGSITHRITTYTYDLARRLVSERHEVSRVDGMGFAPTPILPIQPNAISAGSAHSSAVMSDGSLWTWGLNFGGALGDGTTADRHIPTWIMDDATSVSFGMLSSSAIKTDGSLWVWGTDWVSLFDGGSINRYAPTWIMDDVAAVSVGGMHTMAIKSDGSLWGWGVSVGPLDDGTTAHRRNPVMIMDGIVAVSAGNSFTMAIKSDGSLWGWGQNGNGQLGNGTTTVHRNPTWIMNDVADVSTGNNFTMAIKTDGSLWAWGQNSTGQLGDGTTIQRNNPTWIMDDVATVSAGDNFTMAIKTDGSLWAWGSNTNGRLGDGTTTNRHSPVHIMDDVAMVSTGSSYTMVLKTDNSLWTWGSNYNGQIGDGTTTDRHTPVMIKEGDILPTPTPTHPITTTTTHYTFDNRNNRNTTTIITTTHEDTTHTQIQTTTHTHDLTNRLLSTTKTSSDGSQEATTLTHDRNGNQLTQTTISTTQEGIQTTTTQTNTYNPFNQLVAVTIQTTPNNQGQGQPQQNQPQPTTTTTTYTYRPDGLRSSKTVNNITTTHIWDRNNIILELNDSGAVINRFDRARRGQLVYSYHHGFYLHNARGDVVQRVRNEGGQGLTILHTYRYTAFGNELNTALGNEINQGQGNDANPANNQTNTPDTNTNPFRYAGEYWDHETRTYYLRARHFNPRTGRFTQPDPFWNIHNMANNVAAVMQSSNLFVYTINNPVKWVDPSGLLIRLPANAQERETVMRYMQSLTNHHLFQYRGESGDFYLSYLTIRREDLAGTNQAWLGYGNHLVSRMISDRNTVSISLTDGVNSHQTNSWDAFSIEGTPGAGSGGRIYFNPNLSVSTIVVNEIGIANLEVAPTHIVLAHELIHADRAMRGVMSASGMISVEVPFPGSSMIHTFRFEEFMTIGNPRIGNVGGTGLTFYFAGFTADCITENMIRQEHGLLPRISLFGVVN